MTQIELSPFARRYMEELKSLVTTDRKTISFLRNLAAENHEQEKFHIVVALQQYLYHECPVQQQLPLLYLVDCILKTDTEHYLHTLCPPLPSMFRRVWQTSPDIHPSLAKLANTWRPYLPPQTQAQIDQVTASAVRTSVPPATSAVPIARWTPPHPSLGQGYASAPAPAVRYPTASSADPRLAASQPRPQQQQQHSLSMPRPAAPTSTSLPLHPGRTISPAPTSLHNPLPSTAPVPLLILSQPAATSGGMPSVAGPSLLPMGHMPAPLYQAPCQPTPIFQLPQQTMFPSNTLPQQLQYTQASYNQAPYQDPQLQAPYFPAPIPQPQPFASTSYPSTQAPAASASSSSRDIMSALHSLVSSMNAADHKGQSQGERSAGGAEPTAASQQSAAHRPGRVSGSRSFHPSVIKETDQSAIDALLDASAQSRTSFLDLRFLRTRRLRSAVQSGQPQVQPWYYPLDKWMQGVSAEEHEAAAEGLWNGQEEEDGGGAAAECNVEEDPSQPECAISGEPFERWYDPDTDKWFYQGAVVLTGAAAARHGIMDGSIVKVQCLAGEPSKLGMAARGLGPGAAQGTAGAAGLPAAAAGPGLPASQPPSSPPPSPWELLASKPRSPSPPAATQEAGAKSGAAAAAAQAAVAAAGWLEVAKGGSSSAAGAAAGSCSEAAALQAGPCSLSQQLAAPSSPSAPSPGPPSASPPSWAAAPLEGCAVAALRLEPHVDAAALQQQLRGGEQGVKRGLVLEEGDLTSPAAAAAAAALRGEGQASKKIKMEFSQAV